uniref:Ig-like domain-containing protein n=1 Tax=Amphiprion percula TaxID=161767 RepID=A0A3P8SLG8_AMPPE
MEGNLYLLFSGSSENVLTPFKDVLMSLEGDSVTLSCNYSVSVSNLFWYQQKSSSSPQLLMTAYSEKTEKLSVNHDKQSKELHLNISSAAVSDSAVYYCALEHSDTKCSRGCTKT